MVPAIVRKVNGNKKTLRAISNAVLAIALAEAKGSVRIDIVFDVYRDVSIQNAERQSRSNSVEVIVYKTLFPSQVIQRWDSFKASPVNKTNLIRFIASEWRKENILCITKLGEHNTVMFITCDEECFKIMSNTVELVPELESSQEEADTLMMLHLAHISQYDFSCAVIASIDADVTFLCLTNDHKFPMPLFQKGCSEAKMKYVDIASIRNVLRRNVCEALPGMHAITGCDTVSSFAGKGKLSAFQFVKKKVSFQELFARFGLSWEFSDADVTNLQIFTCSLYGAKKCKSDVNTLRYQLFCSKQANVEGHKLPLCADCLYKHC